jgi:OPA family sugar phosphate sensor protein UhpC-like MFS transporter
MPSDDRQTNRGKGEQLRAGEPVLERHRGPGDSRYDRWRLIIFGITWLAYFGFYFTRKSWSVAKVGVAADPDVLISQGQMGLVDGLFGVAYALGQFLCGSCADRFGPRIVVSAGMFLSAVTAVAMGASSTFVAFGLLFFIQGLCQATGWAPLTKNVSYWFSRTERGRVYGLWSTNYAVGGFVATALAGYTAVVFSNWRFAFFMPAAVLAAVWVLFVVIQKDRPSDVGLPAIEEYHGEAVDVLVRGEKPDQEPEGSWTIIREVFSSPVILFLGAIYFLLKPARYAILFWGPLMISQRLGTDIGQSAIISTTFELAGPVAVIVAGYASDKWFHARRMPVSAISLLCLAVLLLMFDPLTATSGKWGMAVLLFAVGFFLYGPDALISGVAAVDFGTKKGAGSAAGLINGMGSIGQILGLALPGYIAERFGWTVLFTSFGVLTLLAGLLLLPLWNALPASAGNRS